MCIVSMMADHWRTNLPQQPYYSNVISAPAEITRYEFDALRRDVLELKELLKAAKKYDEATGQPDCETDEKVELIRRLAKIAGVDMSEIFGNGDGAR
jgi:hypothetical protein